MATIATAPKFDVDGAKSAGYSDDEIANYLGSQQKFDVDAARKSGYSSQEIIDHLRAPATPQPAPPPDLRAPFGSWSAGEHKSLGETFPKVKPVTDALATVAGYLPSPDSMLGLATPAEGVTGTVAAIAKRALGVGSGLAAGYGTRQAAKSLGAPEWLADTLGTGVGTFVGGRLSAESMSSVSKWLGLTKEDEALAFFKETHGRLPTSAADKLTARAEAAAFKQKIAQELKLKTTVTNPEFPPTGEWQGPEEKPPFTTGAWQGPEPAPETPVDTGAISVKPMSPAARAKMKYGGPTNPRAGMPTGSNPSTGWTPPQEGLTPPPSSPGFPDPGEGFKTKPGVVKSKFTPNPANSGPQGAAPARTKVGRSITPPPGEEGVDPEESGITVSPELQDAIDSNEKLTPEKVKSLANPPKRLAAPPSPRIVNPDYADHPNPTAAEDADLRIAKYAKDNNLVPKSRAELTQDTVDSWRKAVGMKVGKVDPAKSATRLGQLWNRLQE